MLSHLSQTYGHSAFRPSQQEIITSLLEGRNVVTIMPTGGGKSLLYQFVATFSMKPSVVVSPLISLMNDQAMNLAKIGITAVCLNGETKPSERRRIGDAQIIYTTPEHIVSESCSLWRTDLEIGLFAIDEAHCISQWSHDFRPAYQSLSILSTRRPGVPVLAVTATATPLVLAELRAVMRMQDCEVFQEGTHRDNLCIKVLSKDQFHRCDFSRPTIVYVQTRKICESIGDSLSRKGLSTAIYHGGLPKAVKAKAHADFSSGTVRVVVATISFGMGIDKGDVGHVVNYGVPNDIETYYQEIGRAGRDGSESYATIYYDTADFATAHRLIGTCASKPQRVIKQRALRQLRSYLADGERCRQSMIDSYFRSGRVDDVASHSPCKICDNCSRTDPQNGKNMSEQLSAVWKEVGRQKREVGFGTGVLKTAKKLATNPVFYGFTKSRVRSCIEEAITKNMVVQREVRMKNGRLVMILEQGPVEPTCGASLCKQGGTSDRSMGTVVRRKLDEYRRVAARRTNLPEDLILDDAVISRICRDVAEGSGAVQKSSLEGVGLKAQREVVMLVEKTLACERSSRREYLLSKYSNRTQLKDLEPGNEERVANEVLDFCDADVELPLYLHFFGLSEAIEDGVKAALDAHVGASNIFVSKKSGDGAKAYHVRLVRLLS